jgi:hypothetical protein
MSENEGAPVGNDDIKAKFKEALERKQSHDKVDAKGHPKESGHVETHGPAGGPKMHRRKAGGGGA